MPSRRKTGSRNRTPPGAASASGASCRAAPLHHRQHTRRPHSCRMSGTVTRDGKPGGASRQRRKRRHGRFGHHGQYRLPDRHSSIFRTRTMGRAHRPGTAGTGTTRGDGGLPLPRSRDAAMGEAGSLPAIRKTGGDAGRLTGIFTGSSHQGVTGNPERSGRTAAFGGARPGRREGLEPRTVLGRQIQG